MFDLRFTGEKLDMAEKKLRKNKTVEYFSRTLDE